MPNIKKIIVAYDRLFPVPHVVVSGGEKMRVHLFPTKNIADNTVVIECDVCDKNGIRVVYEGEYFVALDYGVNKQFNKSYGSLNSRDVGLEAAIIERVS